MNKKPVIGLLIVILTAILFGGCGTKQDDERRKMDAIATDGSYFAAAQSSENANKVDNCLKADAEHYIKKYFPKKKIVVCTQDAYPSSLKPIVSGYLPIEGFSEAEYAAVSSQITRGIDGIASNFQDENGVIYAILVFSDTEKYGVPGYDIKLYASSENVANPLYQFLSVPLKEWSQPAKKGQCNPDYLIADLLNDKNFRKIDWKVTESFDTEYDSMIMFQGYLNMQDDEDLLVALYSLYDEELEVPIPIYAGYINGAETVQKEAFGTTEDYRQVVKVIEDLCSFVELDKNVNTAHRQTLGEAEDPGPLKNRTDALELAKELELTEGPVSAKTKKGYVVKGALRAVLEPKSVIVVTVNFYDKDQFIIEQKHIKLKAGIGRYDSCRFEVLCSNKSCESYKLVKIETMTQEEYTQQYPRIWGA